VELEAIPARHYAREKCLGYRIIETRKRLKEEFSRLQPEEITRIAREYGQPNLMEEFEKTVLVYSGDSAPLSETYVEGADLLLHDATFLSEKDREEPGHASVEQVLQLGREAHVGGIVLIHVSHRYSLRSVRKRVPQLIDRSRYGGPVWVQWLDRLEKLSQ
jgi:ribonuclease Z